MSDRASVDGGIIHGMAGHTLRGYTHVVLQGRFE